METVVLKAVPRTLIGKGGARQTRRAGLLPAIAYTGGQSPVHFSLVENELVKVLKRTGRNTILRLEFASDQAPLTVLLHEVQKHPVTRRLLHVDFSMIDLNKPVRAKVNLNFTGRAVGQQKGGQMDVIRRQLGIECLPHQIPQILDIDISKVDINEALHIHEITLPAGIKATDDGKLPLMSIAAVKDRTK